jgi:long-subunit fatty acid transport protein
MRKRRFWLFPLILLWMFAFFPKTSWSQMVLGQYEDEAPFRTWNTLGITTAASLAMGETQFTSSYDCSVSLTNPSLLTRLPKINFTVNSSFNTASFFRYSIVNTGPLSTSNNLSAFDFAGASIRLKNWTVALSIGLIESYNRPQAEYEYPPGGTVQYSLGIDQEGDLKNINFSVARKLTGGLSAGIGLNYVYGVLKKDISENWITEPRSITDNKSHKFQGFYFNGGLMLELADKIELAAIFRTPYVKKSESENFLNYFAPAGDTDIILEASSRDEFKQPFVAGIGVSYKFSSGFRAASDLTFFNWSKYKVNYFEEELKRDLKNIVKIGVGIEYLSAGRMFGQEIRMPLRAGFSYDPQPMKNPNSSYFYFSLGTGIHWGKFLLDGGMLLGWERGSGNSLSARKVALSLSFRL